MERVHEAVRSIRVEARRANAKEAISLPDAEHRPRRELHADSEEQRRFCPLGAAGQERTCRFLCEVQPLVGTPLAFVLFLVQVPFHAALVKKKR